VGLWHQRLWRYTRTLVSSDEAANEAIQNVWLRILRGLPALRAPELFPSWAYRIAYRAAMDQLRMKYADALKEPLEDDVDGDGTQKSSWNGSWTWRSFTLRLQNCR
jgi:RNA polymerase sigma-70 factor (ECF subfamily)